MTARVVDEVIKDGMSGERQSKYLFGSSSAKLDVGTSYAKIDSGDMIANKGRGGEAAFTNDHASETLYINMMGSENEDDWATNPERFYQIGDEIPILPKTSKVINWTSKYPYIQMIKKASGAITGGVYGSCRCNGYTN